MMPDPVTIVLLGLAAAGFTLVARKLVPQSWLLIPPCGCDLCMSWWPSAIWGLAISVADPRIDSVRALGGCALPVAVLVFGATAIGVLTTRMISRLGG